MDIRTPAAGGKYPEKYFIVKKIQAQKVTDVDSLYHFK
jgi:hypothetical protein